MFVHFRQNDEVTTTMLRKTPTTSRDKEHFLSPPTILCANQQVRLLEITPGFGRVATDTDEIGWMQLKYLHPIPGETEAEHARPQDHNVQTTMLRIHPTENSEWVPVEHMLRRSEKVEILSLSSDADFVQVRSLASAQRTGWIRIQYLLFPGGLRLRPCKVSSAEYASYIDRNAIGVLEVEFIRSKRRWLKLELQKTEEELYKLRPEKENGGPAEKIEWWAFEKGYGVPKDQAPTAPIKFPEPRDININMMPFVMGSKDSLPEEYQQYWPLIEKCAIPAKESGKIGYLTIQESQVKAGQSQRRSGLHIEAPGTLKEGGNKEDGRYDWGCGTMLLVNPKSEVEGGIYMASNVPNSCKVWNVKISDPDAVVGPLGNIEHLRDLLREGMTLEAGKIYWLTDATPHESLPVSVDTYRQFFRVVTSSLSVWYSAHSTPNRLGIVPHENVTKILKGNKFA